MVSYGPMRTRSLLLPVAALGLAALASCKSSSAPTPGAAAGPTVPVAPTSPWPKFRGTALQDGVGQTHASTTGGAQWSYQTGRGVFSSPVVGGDGTIYVGSADRTFYALNPDGTVKWKLLTGEIIDSAALLDDRGRVYFGSGDAKLRALDAETGSVVWTMNADSPTVNSAFINWFEGNVAIGPTGDLYVPNDNFFLYSVNRDTGTPNWKFRMPDQTWSLPAIDPATGTLVVGNNNMIPLLGKNTFSIGPGGTETWGASSLGTVAASPLLLQDGPGGAVGTAVVGSFDGYVHAYDAVTGKSKWTFPTRDHIYASASRLPDGTIVAASADGTVYGLDPASGTQKWAFDTPAPVRSSPSIDADGNIYFGDGDGRLYVLGPDGAFRWSMLLISDVRNDLNASPALGTDAIYVAGESGQVFSVPYEWCVRPENAKDARCSTTAPTFADGASLQVTTSFGAKEDSPPTSIDPTRSITLSLVVREQGNAILAILDASKLSVTLTPPSPNTVVVSGDGKFVTITPTGAFAAASDGTVSINVSAPYLVDMDRTGLELMGGKPGGTATLAWKPTVNGAGTATLDPATTWELSRLAVPLPKVMPSYNEIGFDSLQYIVGLAELTSDHAVAWMVGGMLDSAGNATVDPATQAVFPLDVGVRGGTLSLSATNGLTVNVMNITLPFTSFRMDVPLDPQGQDGAAPASLVGSSLCSSIPLYGAFLQQLGLCNPQTDNIAFVAAANLTYHGKQTTPAGVGNVVFTAASDGVTATLSGSSLQASAHLASVLLVDAQTGSPVPLGYALDTVRTSAADGTLASVKIPYGSVTPPSSVRAYLMIDTAPAAKATMAL